MKLKTITIESDTPFFNRGQQAYLLIKKPTKGYVVGKIHGEGRYVGSWVWFKGDVDPLEVEVDLHTYEIVTRGCKGC